MQDNSLVIKELGILSELVYNNSYFLSVGGDTLIDQTADNGLRGTYTVKDISIDFNYDSGF